MPNDMYTLKALTDELADNLKGGRVERINQPESDELTFYVHKNKKSVLVISVNPNCPRIHLTDEKKDNPYVAPSFLMLLRKKLGGARIENVSLVGFDRIIKIDFLGRNEMADEVSNTLYVELMGRYSNVILCSDDGTIIEALRHIYPENSFRCILPKIKYTLPQNDKLSPLQTEDIVSALIINDGSDVAKRITSKVTGFSYLTVKELLFRLNVNAETKDVDNDTARKIAVAIGDLYSISSLKNFCPCYTLTEKNEDFFVYPYTHTGDNFINSNTLNDAVRICCLERDRKIRLSSESKITSNAVKSAIKKVEKALSIAKQKVLDCENYDELRICGEIITNNLYLLKKGQDKADLYNYYEDKTITIKLDPMLSPEKNAQAYYKKYSKSKRTISIANEQIIELSKKLDYLYSLKSYLEMCYDPQEIEGIKQEAISSGILEIKQSKKNASKKSLALPPKEYLSDDYTIYRGRNNIDNELITFKIANENDLWVHVKDVHGSHVLVKYNGKPFSNKIIQTACEIAGYYSQGEKNHKIAVDYCERKFVKRNPSGIKGAVIYTNYKTAYVSPIAHTDLEKNK